MRIPKNHGFDLVHGLVITVVLEEGFVVTGRFLGDIDRGHEHCGHENFGGAIQPINVNVDIDAEFILLQLVCPLTIEPGTVLPIGTIVAINIDRISLIAPGGDCAVATV